MELSEVSNKTLVLQRLRKKKENEKLKGNRIERKKKHEVSVESICIHTYVCIQNGLKYVGYDCKQEEHKQWM